MSIPGIMTFGAIDKKYKGWAITTKNSIAHENRGGERMMPGFKILTLLVILLFCVYEGRTQPPDDKYVLVEAATGKLDASRRQVVTIVISIESDWLIYANKPDNVSLADVGMKIKIEGGRELNYMNVRYPKGDLLVFGKETCRVYSGKTTIEATIERSTGDNGPLVVSVTTLPFSVKRGLSSLQRTVKVTSKPKK